MGNGYKAASTAPHCLSPPAMGQLASVQRPGDQYALEDRKRPRDGQGLPRGVDHH